MQRLEVSGAVRPLYGSFGVKGLKAGCQPAVVVAHVNYSLRIQFLFGPRNPNSIFWLITVQHFNNYEHVSFVM